MSKRGTVYVLGAGASHISPSPQAKLPLQKGFFACIAASKLVPQQMVLESFMQQPFRNWLNKNGYGEPYNPKSRLTCDYDLNLEEFYSEIEKDEKITSDVRFHIIKILDRIIFEAISLPIVALRNYPEKTCPNHIALAKLVNSGDTIINFNYDCLADDALLHFSPYWHPVTGYGFIFDDIFGGAPRNKAKIFQSQVLLLKPHGSVTFRFKIKNNNEKLIRLVGLEKGIQPLPMPMTGGWEPFIVAPSTSKSSHQEYMKNILSLAQKKIQRAKKIIVIGYSFPPNDLHVRKIIKRFKGELIVADPFWDSADYRDRLHDIGFANYVGFKGFEEFLKKIAF